MVKRLSLGILLVLAALPLGRLSAAQDPALQTGGVARNAKMSLIRTSNWLSSGETSAR
jgi:hypothetical protein